MDREKIVAIVGANKEGLSLLPLLLKDKGTKVKLIVDDNKDAMAFKLKELGYKFADKYGITLSSELADLERLEDVDVIINASQDPALSTFLYKPQFSRVEILSPLSARLLWGYKKDTRFLKDKDVKDRYSGVLTSLSEIVDAVKLTLDKSDLLSLILRLALDTTGADRGSLMLIGDDGRLKVEVSEGMEEEIERKISIPIGEGIVGYVAKEGKPLIITGKVRDERFSKLMDRTDVKSAMSVPLKLNGRTIGVLNVSSNTSTHAFSREDLDFLNKLAAFDAEIIQRSREYEDMKYTSLKFERWKEIESILRSEDPLEERLKGVCESLSRFIPGLACSILLFDEYSKKLYIRASSIHGLANKVNSKIDIKHGINGWVAKEKKAAFLTDRDVIPQGYPRKFFIALPLIAESSFVGVIEAQLVSLTGLLPYQETFLKELTKPISETIRESLKDKKTYIHSTKLAVINEVGLEIVTTSEDEKLPLMIASSSAVILDAGGAVLRLKEGSGGFKVKAIHGLEEEDRGKVISIEQEVSKETLKTKRPVIRIIDTPDRADGGITSTLSYPIMREDFPVGVLTLFDKIGEDTFSPMPFMPEDVDILGRFIRYAEKALATAYLKEKVKDMEEERPVSPAAPVVKYGAEFFEKRVKEELNRSKRYGRRLLILSIYVPEHGDTDAFMNELKARVEKRIRGFDVVERVEEFKLSVLFPDSDEGALRIIEQLPEWVKEGVVLKYGYAVYPDDAVDFDVLMKKASTPL